MKSAEIYKILNSHLKDELKALNYKKLKYCRLGWYKSIGTNFITFEIHCNKWGWDPFTGTNFTLYIGCKDKISTPSWSVKPVICLNELISSSDLQKLVAIQNEVISKFHRYEENYKDLHPTADPAFLNFLQNQFEPIGFLPTRPDMETMRIYDESDVHRWGEFFKNNIAKISNELEIKWLDQLEST